MQVAAAYPARAHRLALIDPIGFWRDGDRIVNWMMLEPSQLRAHLFRDPEGAAARRMYGGPMIPTPPPRRACGSCGRWA